MSLILHHYPLSPYSEKIRAMLGFTKSEWVSCITTEAPPRGDLDLLTGGYSRIPVAQMGSDIFCDTRLIADEIAQLSGIPSLSDATLSSEDLKLRQWFETKLFFACINRSFSFSLLKRIARDKGVINLLAFLKDRVQMGMSASISMGSPKSAPKYINQAIKDISTRLGIDDFIGGDEPNILDFSAYHCFWFLHEVGQKHDLDQHQKVLGWYHRMNQFSAAPSQEINLDEALKVAQDTTPRALDQQCLQDHRIGSRITIAPNDYRKVPVSGILAGVDERRWIIRREQPETGTVHLHFPVNGVDVTIRLES